MTKNMVLLTGFTLAVLGLLIGCNSSGTGVGSSAWSGLPSAPLPGANGLLAGIISDAGNIPVAGVQISLLQSGITKGSATTDANGSYQISIEAGSYTVRVVKSSYSTVEQAVSVPSAVTTTFNTVISNTVGTLVGKVTTTKSGTAIEGVQIQLRSLTNPVLAISPAYTNATGTYSFTLSTGTYSVTADKTGYGSATANVTITAGSQLTQDFSLTSTFGKLFGLVTNQTDTAQGSVLIRMVPQTPGLSAAEFTTTDDGKYNLTLSAGTYTMTISKSGFATDQRTVQITADVEQLLDIKLGAKVTMTGTVKLTSNQEVLPNINVDTYRDNILIGSTITTSEGKFLFPDLSAGMYAISLARDSTSYSPATYVVQVLASGSTSPADPVLYLSLKVLTGAEVVHPIASGTLFDSYTQAPLEYVNCALKGIGGTLSDNLGRFSFSNLLPGTYELTFSKLGWQTLTVNFSIVATPSVPATIPPSSTTIMLPSSLNYEMIQSQQTNLGAIAGRYMDETLNPVQGVNNLIVRLYKYRLVTKTIQVLKSGQLTDKDVDNWELDGYANPTYYLSTKTGLSGSGNETSSGTFRLEHLQPTTDRVKYVVYIGTGNSGLVSAAYTEAADQSNPKVTWYQEDPTNPNRVHSWALIDVTANTTTYLQNFNMPNF